MPAGSRKSRTLRRVFRRTPSGKNVLRYVKRKPEGAKCSKCSVKLPGVPRERPTKMKNMSKSSKRPERAFGGNLCSKCSRRVIVKENRE